VSIDALRRPEQFPSRACDDFCPATIIKSLATGYVGPSGAAPPPLVLIVEDDVETRQFYKHVLQSVGLRTDEAHNGLQALDKATQEIPDLVLADIAVPGIDGIELCRRLRADERTRHVPLLAITGYGDRQYEDRARAAGANHVLSKPSGADTVAAEALRLLAAESRRRDHAAASVAHKVV